MWKRKKVKKTKGGCEVVYCKRDTSGAEERVELKGHDLDECAKAFGRMLGTLVQAMIVSSQAEQAAEDQQASGETEATPQMEEMAVDDFRKMYG